jgi:hypothetical protein
MATTVIKSSKLARLSRALVMATAAMLILPGCVGVAHVLKANHDVIADKVYRLKVADNGGLNDNAGYERSDTGETAYAKFQTLFKVYGGEPTREQAIPYRFASVSAAGSWEGVTIFNNGPAGNAVAHINDGVPLLKVGDMVDVYMHDTAALSVKDRKHITVIRLVCIAEDKACAEREKRGHRKAYGRVVQPKGQFDERLLNVTPHMDLNGNWLPGKEPKRPALPAGATGATPKASGWEG